MISIIVPCFNSEKYLIDCFDSIKMQTYKDFEIIFVNDGSTDRTNDILNNIKGSNKDLHITIYTQENKGVSVARNIGIQLAKGEYITFVDADDYLYPSFLEKLYQGITMGDMSVVGIGGSGYGKQSDSFSGLITKDKFVYEFWLTRHLWGSNCNKLYSKDIILNNNIYFDSDIKIMEDMFFNMVYCQHIDTIYVSNEILYHYRNNNDSTMHRKFSRTNMTVITTFDKLLNLPLSSDDKKIIELHQVNSLMWLLRCIYKDGNKNDIAKYEKKIFSELEHSNKKIFLAKGWKKGFLRYITFLIYKINPKLYKNVIKLAYKIK